MIKLWRCEICGDPYIGENAPDNCPFCGAHKKYIKDVKSAETNFNVNLNNTDRANSERAFQIEISNSEFYSCASNSIDDNEGKLLFKALGKIEAEHASIWKKILKFTSIPGTYEKCSSKYFDNLKESEERETRAIEFYKKSEKEAQNPRIKQIFGALIEVETDHLNLSSDILKKK